MIARVTLPSGRTVIDTGKVLVGILAAPKPAEQGSHAQLLQRLLTTPLPPREWHSHPVRFHVSPSLWQRVARLINPNA